MKLIKLNAIDSTNEYVKKIKSSVDDKLFCVYTFNQTEGKGQRGNTWVTDPYKNLCASICYKPANPDTNYTSFKINMLVSITLLDFFQALKVSNIKIKWPNDILSGNKKIAGILIETSIRSDKTNDYIIGIGLNINQEKFNQINNADSIKNINNMDYDLNEITNRFLDLFKNFDLKFNRLSIDDVKNEYLKNLYGLNTNLNFLKNDDEFEARIIDVVSDNKIKLLVNNKKIVFDSRDLKLVF